MIITLSIQFENTSHDIFISYENFFWKLVNTSDIERFLPFSLDYDLFLKNDTTKLDLHYKKITPKMKDYFWILVLKTIAGDLKNISILDEHEKNAEIALNDFFKMILDEGESYSDFSQSVSVDVS